MFSLTKRLGLAAMLGLAVLAVTGPKAHGQSPYFQVRPGLTLQQAAFNVAVMGQALQNIPPYFYGVNPYPRVSLGGGTLANNPYASPYGSLYSSPYGGGYGGYGGYVDSYYPESSYLYAGAKVISAQGEFMVKQQQAFRMLEQVKADRIENR